MSKDKQIEEMAKVIKSSLDGLGSGNFNFTGDEISTMFAEALYNAGYRKTSDIAREIFKGIYKILESDKFGEVKFDIRELYKIEKKYTEVGMSTYEKMVERRRYKKVCPFCKSVCENFKGSNLFCKCNAKYYYFDGVWIKRESEDTE